MACNMPGEHRHLADAQRHLAAELPSFYEHEPPAMPPPHAPVQQKRGCAPARLIPARTLGIVSRETCRPVFLR